MKNNRNPTHIVKLGNQAIDGQQIVEIFEDVVKLTYMSTTENLRNPSLATVAHLNNGQIELFLDKQVQEDHDQILECAKMLGTVEEVEDSQIPLLID